MTQAHLPDLNALAMLADKQIKFYAVIGAVVSLTAAIELKYANIFAKALKIDDEIAGKIIFKAKAASLQRDMAIAAMEHRLSGDPLQLRWKIIADNLKTATGQSGLRHLIAHNIVTRLELSGAFGGAPFGSLPFGAGIEESFTVSQDRNKVLAGIHNPQQATFDHLLTFCRTLIALLHDVEIFLTQLP